MRACTSRFCIQAVQISRRVVFESPRQPAERRFTAAPATVRVLTRLSGRGGLCSDTISSLTDPDPCGLPHPFLTSSLRTPAKIQDPSSRRAPVEAGSCWGSFEEPWFEVDGRFELTNLVYAYGSMANARA